MREENIKQKKFHNRAYRFSPSQFRVAVGIKSNLFVVCFCIKTDIKTMGTVKNNGTTTSEYKLGNNLKVLEQNDQIKELQTIIRDRYGLFDSEQSIEIVWFLISFSLLFRNTSRSDFKFYADRLIRLVIEESLNQLPYSDCSVVTPTGAIYDGLK